MNPPIAPSRTRVLVTGGLGFIGSHFVELLLEKGYEVINIDKRTYAARTDISFEANPNYELIEQDICELAHLPPNISFVVNFAAESHVDNSILANESFFWSNTKGVYTLLELLRAKDASDRPLLIHVSTDEVYGQKLEGSNHESDVLYPSNPYSATKAAAEQLIYGWRQTYGVLYRICRSSNNYGEGQYPEKLIPKTIKMAQEGKKMTVHGDGSYEREWTYVKDNCTGILAVMERGENNEIYNISSGEMRENLEIVQMVLAAMHLPTDFYEFVENRIGQDVRYSIDASKIRSLGWTPRTTLESFFNRYLNNNE